MTGLTLRVEPALDRLGPEWDAVFAASAGLQTSREWFAAIAEAALDPGIEPRFIAVSGQDRPLLLLPMLQPGGRTWQSLTTPYTCLWQPLLQPGLARPLATEAFRMAGQYCRRYAVTTMEALDPDWPELPSMLGGMRAAGLACRSFDHFANWYATISGGWDAYLAGRPGALRETIRRKMRAFGSDASLRIEIAAAPEEIERALPAYEAVYARSWKEPEPFPRFNQVVVGRLAGTGGMRMLTMWSADRPVAAQYWIVTGGRATVLKLAHDEQDKRLSPGTVLTAAAIRYLIEQEGIRELDFGRGDDPYKRSWTGERRQRVGVLVVNMATWQGLAAATRHDAGRVRQQFHETAARIKGALTTSG